MKHIKQVLKEFAPAFLKRGIALGVTMTLLHVSLAVAEPATGVNGSPALRDEAAVQTELFPISNFETVTIKVSAYSAEADQTDARYWEMASGKDVYIGAIACPRRFEFDSKVIINGEMYTCEDRMAGKYDASDGVAIEERFDILMETRQEALNWGVRTVVATIIPK